MITKETRLVGGMGSKYVDGTASPSLVENLNHFMIEAREDTTLTAVGGVDDTGAAVDILAKWGLSSAITLYKGEQYFCSLNDKITSIDVLTGSVKLN